MGHHVMVVVIVIDKHRTTYCWHVKKTRSMQTSLPVFS